MSQISPFAPTQRTVDAVNPLLVQIDRPASINALVGNPEAAGWPELDRQWKIMLGEWNELTKNVRERNYNILPDDIADLIFTLIGFSHAGGFVKDIGENFQRVCDSQFNKFDTTPEDAAITASRYSAKGMQVYTEIATYGDQNFYITKSAIDQINPGRNESIPAGKWLKSYKFEEATLIVPHYRVFDFLTPTIVEELK